MWKITLIKQKKGLKSKNILNRNIKGMISLIFSFHFSFFSSSPMSHISNTDKEHLKYLLINMVSSSISPWGSGKNIQDDGSCLHLYNLTTPHHTTYVPWVLPHLSAFAHSVPHTKISPSRSISDLTSHWAFTWSLSPTFQTQVW